MSTCDVAASISNFLDAAPLERRCLLAIVFRTDPEDLSPFRRAFDKADADGDGRLSRADLAAWVEDRRGVLPERVSAEMLVAAMNVDRTGCVSFPEFAAACLHSKLAPLDRWLAGQVFETLDANGDGLLSSDDVRPIFGDLLVDLPPSGRPFGLFEWLGYLQPALSRGSSLAAMKAIDVSTSNVDCIEEPLSPGGLYGGSTCTPAPACTLWTSLFAWDAGAPRGHVAKRPAAAGGEAGRGRNGPVRGARASSDREEEVQLGIFGRLPSEALSSPAYVPVH